MFASVDQPTLIFPHVPKTAGTTLSQIIVRQYGRGEVFHVRSPKHDTAPTYGDHVGGTEDFIGLSVEERTRFRCILGHMNFGLHEHVPRPSTYVTMLREPVERVLSQHRQYVHHHLATGEIGPDEIPSPEAYLESKPKVLENRQTKFLCGEGPDDFIPDDASLEKALDHLRNDFSVVGLAERFDESLLLMARQFGWSDVRYVPQNITSRYRVDYSPELLETIKAKSRLDLVLYGEAQRRLEEDVRGHGDSFQRDLRRFQKANRIPRAAAAEVRRSLFRRVRDFLAGAWRAVK